MLIAGTGSICAGARPGNGQNVAVERCWYTSQTVDEVDIDVFVPCLVVCVKIAHQLLYSSSELSEIITIITSLDYLVSKVFWEETAFPFWRAVGKGYGKQ